jgi:hypothetical protein
LNRSWIFQQINSHARLGHNFVAFPFHDIELRRD